MTQFAHFHARSKRWHPVAQKRIRENRKVAGYTWLRHRRLGSDVIHIHDLPVSVLSQVDLPTPRGPKRKNE